MHKALPIIITLTLLPSCMEQQKMENIIIIGGGLMGSATAWELSAAGEDVLLLEQQDSIYTYGSSQGEARISRSLGPKDDLFSWLQQTSVAEVQKLLLYLNKVDGPGTHSMEDIYTTSPVTYLMYTSQKAIIDSLLDDQADSHEVAVGSAAAKEKFGMAVPDSMTMIREYKPYSGTLNPRVLISKMQQGTLKKENRIQYHSNVTRLTKKEGYYELEVTDTHSGKTTLLRAKKVVSAAGPYTGPLLKDVAPYMDTLIDTKRLFLAFFKPTKAAWEALGPEGQRRLTEFYPVADLDPEIYYSMIEDYDTDGRPIIKVGGHFKRTDIQNLDEVWKLPVTQAEQDWARNRTLNYLQEIGIPMTAKDFIFHKGYSCVYSLTTSEIPLVTPAVINGQPDPSLVMVAGLSGVGAKGALAYGLLAANQLMGKTVDPKMYQKALRLMGPERLEKDLFDLDKKQAKKVAGLDVFEKGFLFKGN